MRRDGQFRLDELPVGQFITAHLRLDGLAEILRLIRTERWDFHRKLEDRIASGGLDGNVGIEIREIGRRMIDDNELNLGVLLCVLADSNSSDFQMLRQRVSATSACRGTSPLLR